MPDKQVKFGAKKVSYAVNNIDGPWIICLTSLIHEYLRRLSCASSPLTCSLTVISLSCLTRILLGNDGSGRKDIYHGLGSEDVYQNFIVCLNARGFWPSTKGKACESHLLYILGVLCLAESIVVLPMPDGRLIACVEAYIYIYIIYYQPYTTSLGDFRLGTQIEQTNQPRLGINNTKSRPSDTRKTRWSRPFVFTSSRRSQTESNSLFVFYAAIHITHAENMAPGFAGERRDISSQDIMRLTGW